MKKLLLLPLILVLLTVPNGVSANAYLFGPPITVTATTTSTQVLAANSLRSYLLIQNNGANSAIIKFGSAQTGTEGIVIIATGNYEPIKAPANSVYAETASSTTSLTIIQGQ